MSNNRPLCTVTEMLQETIGSSTWVSIRQNPNNFFLNLLHIDIFEQILKYLNSMDLLNLYQADKNHRDLIGRKLRKYKFVCPICDKSTYGIPYVDSCHIITLK